MAINANELLHNVKILAGLHTFGENLDEFADHIVGKMEESDSNLEIGFKMSENIRNASAEQRAGAFAGMNGATSY